MFRRLIKHKLRTGIIALLLVIGLFTWRVDVSMHTAALHQQQVQASQLASAKSACSLDPQQFMATVNQWRSAKGVAPLQYSTQLQSAAQARIADMEEYKFYGHDNPFTKHDNGYFTQKYDPAATWWDEVLDGPNNAKQAVTDFRNSQPHYDALTDSRENYIGVVSVYYPESWDDYDNKGKLQTTSDTVILNGKTETVTTPVSGDGTCIVVGQLADKVR